MDAKCKTTGSNEDLERKKEEKLDVCLSSRILQVLMKLVAKVPVIIQ